MRAILAAAIACCAFAAVSVTGSVTREFGEVPKSCQALWETKVQRWETRYALRQTYMDSGPNWSKFSSSPKTAFDLFEAEWECEVQDRVGKLFGDGGKFVCGLPVVARDKQCLVYSVGSRLDLTFEKDVLENTQCEVHTFDPTVREENVLETAKHHDYNLPLERFKFHPIGLSHYDGEMEKVGRVQPLEQLAKSLGHEGRRLALFKVDCEGCEYKAFEPIFQACAAGKLQIDQLMIELHVHTFEAPADFAPLEEFFRGADACGLMIFHKERNHWGCAGYRCVEFSFISRTAAREAFIDSHCPGIWSMARHHHHL